MQNTLSKAFYHAIKYHARCVICDTKESIQFHHVRPADKVSEVHKLARTSSLRATILEFNKCVPMCDLHHRQAHNGQLKGWLSGNFNNGEPSHAGEAYKRPPYLVWLAREKPFVFRQFYYDHLHDSVKVLAELGDTGLLPPGVHRLPLFPVDHIDSSQLQRRGVLYDMRGNAIG